jgi:hypothetical protein
MTTNNYRFSTTRTEARQRQEQERLERRTQQHIAQLHIPQARPERTLEHIVLSGLLEFQELQRVETHETQLENLFYELPVLNDGRVLINSNTENSMATQQAQASIHQKQSEQHKIAADFYDKMLSVHRPAPAA